MDNELLTLGEEPEIWNSYLCKSQSLNFQGLLVVACLEKPPCPKIPHFLITCQDAAASKSPVLVTWIVLNQGRVSNIIWCCVRLRKEILVQNFYCFFSALSAPTGDTDWPPISLLSDVRKKLLLCANNWLNFLNFLHRWFVLVQWQNWKSCLEWKSRISIEKGGSETLHCLEIDE